MVDAELRSCIYGPDDATNSIALVGGSHSAQWFPAIKRTLENMPDWHLVTYNKAGCPFHTGPYWGAPETQRSCDEWNKRVMERLLNKKPTIVFTTATRTAYPRGSGEEVPEGYRDQWLPLLEAGVRVVAVRDTPRFGFNVPECVDIKGRTSPRCTLQRQELLANTNPALALPEANRLDLIDLSDSFCTSSTCPPVVGNILVYRDKGHIAPAYMRTLAQLFANKLRPILANAADEY
jgi:hypothetical protein